VSELPPEVTPSGTRVAGDGAVGAPVRAVGAPGPLIRLRHMLPELAEKEHRIATWLLEHADRVPSSTVTSIAEELDVSQAAIVRVCKRLGLSGFRELKLVLTDEVFAPDRLPQHGVAPDDSVAEIMLKVIDNTVQSLRDTATIADVPVLERVVDAIAGCDQLHFYGTMGSGAVAYDGYLKFLGIGVCSAYATDPPVQGMLAASLTDRSVAVGISNSGEDEAVINALATARRHGATTVAITRFGRSPVSAVAQETIFYASVEVPPRDKNLAARSVQLSLINTMYLAVFIRRQPGSSQRSREIERAVLPVRALGTSAVDPD
jgi:DNA-binding MurR/RpiR family transcriptional regulator